MEQGKRLEKKSAVVTGAANGIGRATALLFAREGARLVIADVKSEEGEALAREIRNEGGKATFIRTDVRLREDNERMIDACCAAYGSIDILFCNAGMYLPKLITENEDEDVERIISVNVKALVHATRYAIPFMLEQDTGGAILFNASKTGLVAQVGSPMYCATKGAAIMLARALALDYATKGIRVNALCPGVIDTPMLRASAEVFPDPDVAWQEFSRSQPMGRLGTAEECAEAALWLVSDESSFITGVALPVDGGFTAM
jgi:NAD(P)-dependent dehydrogenase (short-subunit alcohol dehydrogenase family)